MKIFENNAIRPMLVILCCLCFWCFENIKTQNKNKSFAYVLDVIKKSPINGEVKYAASLNKSIASRIYRNKDAFSFSKEFFKRKKRFILYDNGGIVKLVVGVSYPIILADSVRSLNYIYNLQPQYTPPPRPFYFWSLYNTTTFPIAKKWRRQTNLDEKNLDPSREVIYEAIKILFKRFGLPDEQCLLKMICEISGNPFHVPFRGNILHEFLNAIFIPTLQNVDTKYLDAFKAGHYGATCNYQCPKHISWLERNSILL